MLENGIIVGRVFTVPTAPPGRPWMWGERPPAGTIKRAAHGYEPTREAAMAAFAKSWRREVMTEGACNFLRANAYHEAGHAIVAWALRLHVYSITICDDRPGENAETAGADGLPLVDQVAVEAAGREAGVLFGHPLPDWASGADRRVIINLLLASKIPELEIPTCAPLLAGKERARHLLTKHAPDVHKLAARLMECRHMKSDEFRLLWRTRIDDGSIPGAAFAKSWRRQ